MECPEQRERAGREHARKVEGRHHLALPLLEKSSFLASSSAVDRSQVKEITLRVFQNAEAWRKGRAGYLQVGREGDGILWQRHGGSSYEVRARLCHQDADMFPPPGLLDVSNPVQYIETSSGGDGDWLAFSSTKLYTNAFIVSPDPPQKVAS